MHSVLTDDASPLSSPCLQEREHTDHLVFDEDGIDLLTLSRLAERLGFKTRGVKTSYDAIATCRLPAISHVRRRFGSGHFAVLHHWNRDHVVVADPARGLRKISRKAYCAHRTGYILLIEPKL